ncbi:MAG: response regulator transcription factor [Rikenellaceae bacterium]|nr:response regulator transcription factor [Rikenellaceae bacterium]
MKALIIEDEVIASQTLKRLLKEIRPDYEIMSICQTIRESIQWFEDNPMPDLVFMDIHLADGSSFSIFENISIDRPIIFTTAYSEHTLEAFEVNGIDYLLKPINKTRLLKAIEKFESLAHNNDGTGNILRQLIDTIQTNNSRLRTHFLVPHRNKLIPLAVENIAYVCAEMKTARVFTFDGHNYPLDYSLEELTKKLDKERFFRVNRQYIVCHNALV